MEASLFRVKLDRAKEALEKIAGLCANCGGYREVDKDHCKACDVHGTIAEAALNELK